MARGLFGSLAVVLLIFAGNLSKTYFFLDIWGCWSCYSSWQDCIFNSRLESGMKGSRSVEISPKYFISPQFLKPVLGNWLKYQLAEIQWFGLITRLFVYIIPCLMKWIIFLFVYILHPSCNYSIPSFRKSIVRTIPV